MYVRASSVFFGHVSAGEEVGASVLLWQVESLNMLAHSPYFRIVLARFSHLFLICSISLTHKYLRKGAAYEHGFKS